MVFVFIVQIGQTSERFKFNEVLGEQGFKRQIHMVKDIG